MKVVVLNHNSAPAGQFEQAFSQFNNCEIHHNVVNKDVIDLAKDADYLLVTVSIKMDAKTLEQLPNLKYIGNISTGYNNVDLAAAEAKGITVCNVPDYSSDSVAQTGFALLLELIHHCYYHNQQARAGNWMKSTDPFYEKEPIIELNNHYMGIIGFGHIGKHVARIAQSFGMKIICSTIDPPKDQFPEIEFTNLDELLTKSDVVSINVPLLPSTQNMINKNTLKKMKPSAYLINTSRGPIINEADLAVALKNREIAGAGLDVLVNEPPEPNNPLLHLDNCLITPHIGARSTQARKRVLEITAENLQAYINGTPTNIAK